MARTLIGLDVGTAAVRAAELRFGRGRPELVRFAQIALAPGAVVAGEVVDVLAVSDALKRLWKEGGFAGKRVVTGVAGQRVVARTTEMPAMSDDDLRSSLPFQVQELIPIPLDESVIDHQVLEAFAEEGAEKLRVLVVAAHRDVIRSLLAALEGAGLEAARVDLIPLALIRALHEPGFAELADGSDGATVEAIVDLGAGVTNVVVHEHGVPRFMRSLATGGVELTEALVTDLGVDYDEAEALKRRTDESVESQHARDVLRAALNPLLEEVRTSIEFWQAQSPDQDLRHLVVTGGASRPPDVLVRLERLIAVPVTAASAFARIDTKAAGLDAPTLEAADAVASVAVGLALSGESTGVRRISLVPVEIAVRRRERRQVLLAGAGVAAFAVLLLGVYGLRSGQVSSARKDATRTEERGVQLRAQIASLQDVEALEADIATRHQTVITVLTGDIAWSRVIQEVAAVLPNDVWLTGFTGTSATLTAKGVVTFAAMGFDQTSTARWILRVSELGALHGLWVPSSTKSSGGGAARELVTFSSNATLTPGASSSRAERYAK